MKLFGSRQWWVCVLESEWERRDGRVRQPWTRLHGPRVEDRLWRTSRFWRWVADLRITWVAGVSIRDRKIIRLSSFDYWV